MVTMCRESLIPLESLRSRLDVQDAQAGTVWKRVPDAADLEPGATLVAEAGGTRLLVCRFGSELLAYHDTCVRCGQSLGGAALTGLLNDAVLRCPGCDASYDVCHSGASVDDPAAHLTQVPLLVERGVVSVAVPLPSSGIALGV